MALLDRIGAHREAVRSDEVTQQEFADLLTGSTGRARSGVTVTDQRVLGLSAWWRGVRYLSETVAGLPIFTYLRTGGDERRKVVSPGWLARPSEEVPRFALFEFYMMSMLHRGNAFGFKNRGDTGQVVDIVPLHPDRVRYGLADGRKVFEVTGNDQRKHSFTSREILHIPSLSSDGYFGIDPIRAHVHGLGAVAAADEFAGRAFSQGTSMGGYIKMPGRLDDVEADRVRAQWRRLHNGLANAHEFGILGDGATYETIGLDPQQTQLLETRKYGVTEIARILGVVPHKLYDLERATFSNIEHQAIESVQDSIMPWLIRLETWINHDRSLVSPTTFHEFVVEGLLRGDTKARMEAYSIAISGGFMSPHFAASRENWDAPDALRYWQRPLNTALLTEESAPGGDTDPQELEVGGQST